MSTYNWPTQYNEHKDRKENPYYVMLKEGAEVIPIEDDYSEDSFPNCRPRNSFDSGMHREGIGSVNPSK